jgi:hypothetical protein
MITHSARELKGPLTGAYRIVFSAVQELQPDVGVAGLKKLTGLPEGTLYGALHFLVYRGYLTRTIQGKEGHARRYYNVAQHRSK